MLRLTRRSGSSSTSRHFTIGEPYRALLAVPIPDDPAVAPRLRRHGLPAKSDAEGDGPLRRAPQGILGPATRAGLRSHPTRSSSCFAVTLRPPSSTCGLTPPVTTGPLALEMLKSFLTAGFACMLDHASTTRCSDQAEHSAYSAGRTTNGFGVGTSSGWLSATDDAMRRIGTTTRVCLIRNSWGPDGATWGTAGYPSPTCGTGVPR